MSARLTVFVGCVVSALAGGSSVAQPADAVKEKLDAARAAYQAALEKYRDGAADWLDRRERDARAKGDKKAVDQIKEERQAFEVKDELPDAAPAAVKRLLTKAQADMVAAYEAAVKEYTKDKKTDAEAAAVEKELDRFKKHEIADPADRLRAGAVWSAKGVTPGRPAGEQMTFTVLERNGERFKARFEVSAGGLTRVIHGHVKGRQVWWTPDDVTVEKGTGKGLDNFGYINGKQMRIRYVGRDAKGVAGFGVVDFRLVEGK
jgi:hypothetical protein